MQVIYEISEQHLSTNAKDSCNINAQKYIKKSNYSKTFQGYTYQNNNIKWDYYYELIKIFLMMLSSLKSLNLSISNST